jgi:hypothetical protein
VFPVRYGLHSYILCRKNFSCSPPDSNLSKLSSLSRKATTFIFQNYTKSKITIPRLLSRATASNHSNAFTFTLLLSKGQAGEAWEPSYKMTFFPLPTIKCLSVFPGLFTCIYSSTFYLYLSLHLKGFRGAVYDLYNRMPFSLVQLTHGALK